MVLRKRGLKVAALLLAISMAFGSVGFANDVNSNGKSDYSQDRKIVARVDAERAIEHVRYLSGGIGPRPSGLKAEKESAEYIANVLKGYGYEVEYQYFPVADQYIADVVLADGTSWQMGAAPNGKVSKEAVTGEVLFVDGGTNLADFPADTEGKIVVMPRASTTAAYRTQVDNAVEAGAAGVILQSLVGSRGNYGQTFNPSLSNQVEIPVYGAAFIQENGLKNDLQKALLNSV